MKAVPDRASQEAVIRQAADLAAVAEQGSLPGESELAFLLGLLEDQRKPVQRSGVPPFDC